MKTTRLHNFSRSIAHGIYLKGEEKGRRYLPLLFISLLYMRAPEEFVPVQSESLDSGNSTKGISALGSG